MNPNNLLDIYAIVCAFTENHNKRVKYAQFREKYLKPVLVKNAFDTRRINQNTEFNPRRNLQYYQRSEPYIDEKTAEQIKLFFKVKVATDDIREEFIGEPDWLDSYTRILCNAIDQTLRVEQKDYDYSGPQLDYLSELLYVRYRLQAADIANATPALLRQAFLNKDEKLLRRAVFTNYKDGLNTQTVHQEQDIQKNSDVHKNIGVKNINTKGKIKTKKNKDVDKSITININVNNDNDDDNNNDIDIDEE